MNAAGPISDNEGRFNGMRAVGSDTMVFMQPRFALFVARMSRSTSPSAASPVIPMDGPAPELGRWESRRVRLPHGLQKIGGALDRLLAWSWNTPAVFAALVLAAVVSAVWGYVTFYGPQYPGVPWYLWLFVPDSPFALTLWIAAAFAVKAGWDRLPGKTGPAVALLAAWAAAVNVKIGLWTPFILLFYSDVFFAAAPGKQAFQVLLLVAHAGMVGLALLLLRKMRALPAVGYVAVLALLFLWDFMDYFFVGFFFPESGITVYPLGITAQPTRLMVTMVVTMGLSVFCALGVWAGVRLRGPPSTR